MNITILIKKEILELVKTQKFLILISVFLVFALSGPIFANLEPILIESLTKSLGEGTILKVPPPTFKNAYMQMFQNLNQTGIIVLILIFAGAVVDEKAKGTAALVLTKCVSRHTFILSKLIARIVLFCIIYIIALSLCVFYTQIIFSEFYVPHIIFSFLLYFVYGLCIICLSIFTSVVSKSFVAAVALSITAHITFSVVGFIPYIDKYSPSHLLRLITEIINGVKNPNDSIFALLVTLALSLFFVEASIIIFRKQEI